MYFIYPCVLLSDSPNYSCMSIHPTVHPLGFYFTPQISCNYLVHILSLYYPIMNSHLFYFTLFFYSYRSRTRSFYFVYFLCINTDLTPLVYNYIHILSPSYLHLHGPFQYLAATQATTYTIHLTFNSDYSPYLLINSFFPPFIYFHTAAHQPRGLLWTRFTPSLFTLLLHPSLPSHFPITLPLFLILFDVASPYILFLHRTGSR